MDLERKLLDFKKIWEKSEILQLFIPDWAEYQEMVLNGYDNVNHIPITLNAYLYGYLPQFKEIFQKVLFRSGRKIRNDYKRHFHEKWLKKNNEIERENYFKKFFGKVVEIYYCSYLLDNGWNIVDLEAWNADATDIVAKSVSGDIFHIDVKYVGSYTPFFEIFVETNKNAAASTDNSCDYIYLKIQEAYRKKKGHVDKNILVIMTDPIFNFMDFQRWLDFGSPKIKGSEEFCDVLNRQGFDLSQFKREIPEMIKGFNDIGIYKIKDCLPEKIVSKNNILP